MADKMEYPPAPIRKYLEEHSPIYVKFIKTCEEVTHQSLVIE